MTIPFGSSFLDHPRTRDAARAADPFVFEAAVEIVACVFYQLPDLGDFFKTKALTTAANLKQRFQSELARRGGLAPKADTFTLLIERIALSKPDITELGLEKELERCCETRDIVQDFDENEISFVNHDGRTKTAKRFSRLSAYG